MEAVENKNNLLDSVDARTRLAGSNKMEILLFNLGTREIFGINVFKVREVGRTPHITKTPNMPRGVEGLISLRGNVIPVLSLASFLKLEGVPPGLGKTMMVAEYAKRTLGFLVSSGRFLVMHLNGAVITSSFKLFNFKFPPSSRCFPYSVPPLHFV